MIGKNELSQKNTSIPKGHSQCDFQEPAGYSRRDFLKHSGYALAGGIAAASIPSAKTLFAQEASPKRLIWANLVHLGYNMWCDREVEACRKPGKARHVCAKPYLRFDNSLWNDILKKMVDVGTNMVVIELGEGVKYKSHPELAVKNSWSTTHLKEELSKIRSMGLEPIPKLNFSTCHDHWLGPYSRCVSTPQYYSVCRDLIAEVSELFDKPRFFHLGYDEETAAHQRRFNYVVIRQHELWWDDFLFFVNEVEKHKVRPWIWSDYVWHHTEEFYKKMPKSVLQSNWYYGTDFGKFEKADEAFKKNLTYTRLKTYIDLEKYGYDQVPTGSNWSTPENFQKLVEFCKKHIDSPRLLGFMQTPWVPTLEEFRQRHIEAIEQVGRAIAETG